MEMGHGLDPSVAPSHTHFHSMASLSFCVFLTLPHSPPSGSLPFFSFFVFLDILLDYSLAFLINFSKIYVFKFDFLYFFVDMRVDFIRSMVAHGLYILY